MGTVCRNRPVARIGHVTDARTGYQAIGITTSDEYGRATDVYGASFAPARATPADRCAASRTLRASEWIRYL